jgi:excisionase family DNA binding protein
MPQAIQVEHDGLNRAQRRAQASDKRRVRPRFGGDEHHVRPRFVSIREACRYLGCSKSHFYAALMAKVKTVTLGKRRLVDFDSLEELADELLAAG